MIAKVQRGPRATGLLKYLFGPGDRNEHINARTVGGWTTQEELDRLSPSRLGQLLDQTWQNAHMTELDSPVYHVSVAVDRGDPSKGTPADPDLTDEQFREVCEALIDRVGLSACRWVAVRHDRPGESHAHIVATLASEEGRQQHPLRGDFFRIGEVCREYERKFGLRVTAPRDRTRTAPGRAAEGDREPLGEADADAVAASGPRGRRPVGVGRGLPQAAAPTRVYTSACARRTGASSVTPWRWTG